MDSLWHKLSDSYNRWLSHVDKHPFHWLLIFAAITIIATVASLRLRITTDFVDLLPDDAQSVQALRAVMDRVGGVGSLILAVESPSFEDNRTLLRQAVEAIKSAQIQGIRTIEFEGKAVDDFFDQHALLYLSVSDLKQINKTAQQEIERAKLKANPMWFSLDEEDEPAHDDISLEQWQEKLKEHTPHYYSMHEGYFGTHQGKLLIAIIRPFGTHTHIDATRVMVEQVKETVNRVRNELNLTHVEFGFCGNIQSTLEEYDTVISDIVSTLVICVSLIVLLLLVYFRNIWLVLTLAISLIASVIWSLALISIFYPKINTQSAFLTALIIGTGINYGLIALSRFSQIYQTSHPILNCLAQAMKLSARGTLLASLTSAGAFFSLFITDNRGLSQFAWMGSVGVIIAWIGAYVLIPPLLISLARFNCKLTSTLTTLTLLQNVPGIIVRYRQSMTIVVIAICLFSSLMVGLYLPDIKETDLSRLRTQRSLEDGTEALEKRVSQIFGQSMTPAIFLVPQPEMASLLCKQIERNQGSRTESFVAGCHQINDLVPGEQAEKQMALSELRILLNDSSVKFLSNEMKDVVDFLRQRAQPPILSAYDLPQQLVTPFREKDGSLGKLVFVNPRAGNILSKSDTLLAFHQEVGQIELASGDIFFAAGEAMILADLLRFLDTQGPQILLLSFLIVISLIFLTQRPWRKAGPIIASLIFGFLLVCATLSLASMKINFFNFIALPLAFGISIDYASNLLMRIRSETAVISTSADNCSDVSSQYAAAYREGATAVIICSLTTIIGYGSLLPAHNLAVRSFGLVALVGEIAGLLSALVIIPWLASHSKMTRSIN